MKKCFILKSSEGNYFQIVLSQLSAGLNVRFPGPELSQQAETQHYAEKAKN